MSAFRIALFLVALPLGILLAVSAVFLDGARVGEVHSRGLAEARAADSDREELGHQGALAGEEGRSLGAPQSGVRPVSAGRWPADPSPQSSGWNPGTPQARPATTEPGSGDPGGTNSGGSDAWPVKGPGPTQRGQVVMESGEALDSGIRIKVRRRGPVSDGRGGSVPALVEPSRAWEPVEVAPDGTFQFAAPSGPSYEILVIATATPAVTEVLRSRPDDAPRFSVTVRRAVTLDGFVLQSDGATPIADAFVTLDQGGDNATGVRTDARGYYRFPSVTSVFGEVRVSHPAYRPQRAPFFPRGNASPAYKRLDFQLEAGGSVEVQVRTEGAVADAHPIKLVLFDELRRLVAGEVLVTATNPRTRFLSLHPDTPYRVTAYSEEQPADSQVFLTGPAGQAGPVELTIGSPWSLVGNVVAPDGGLVANMVLTLFAEGAAEGGALQVARLRTGADGSFEFRELNSSLRYRLEGAHDPVSSEAGPPRRYAMTCRTGIGSETREGGEVRITVAPQIAAEIRGSLLDPASEQPLLDALVQVRVMRSVGYCGDLLLFAQPFADGSFVVPGLPAGEVRLVLLSNTHSFSRTESFTLSAGQSLNLGALALSPR